MPTNREIDSTALLVATDVPTETDPIEFQFEQLNEQLRMLRGAIEEMQSVINAAVDRATRGDAFSDSSYRRWPHSPPHLPKGFWGAPIVDWSQYDLHGNWIGLRQHRRMWRR